MTVRELRELFFKIENQDQQVMVSLKDGNWCIKGIDNSWDVFNGDIIVIKPVNQ